MNSLIRASLRPHILKSPQRLQSPIWIHNRCLFAGFRKPQESTAAPSSPANEAAEDVTETKSTASGDSEQQPPAPDSKASVDNEHVEQIKTLEAKVKEFKDCYLRALADAENLRERTKKEKELAQQLAIKKFAVDLLAVTDILEIALESVPVEERNNEQNVHLKNLYTGLSMTHAELLASFRRNGLESFDALGQKFNPNEHQALFQAPVSDKEPGSVFNVTKKGYKLNGIVVRAAQVGVVQE